MACKDAPGPRRNPGLHAASRKSLDPHRYNPLEELVEAENSSGELNFAYDGAGNLLTEANGAPCPASTATASEPTATLSYTSGGPHMGGKEGGEAAE